MRLSEQRRWADICSFGIGWYVTPADQSLSFFEDDLINGFYALLSFDRISGQKDIAYGITAGLR